MFKSVLAFSKIRRRKEYVGKNEIPVWAFYMCNSGGIVFQLDTAGKPCMGRMPRW